MTPNQSLSIVIPAYNEASRILKCLDDIDLYIKKSSLIVIEVLIISDGSVDDTEKVASDWINNSSINKNIYKIISYKPNKGKGYAVREGFKHAIGDLVIYTDADGASPIEEVEKLLIEINNGFDVVCGSRILKEKDVKVEMSIIRRFVGLVFQTILKTLGLAPLKDTQCGFKLFKSEVVKFLIRNQKCFNFSFDIEYLFLISKLNFKIKEVSINWNQIEGSKVNIVRDSIKMLIEVFKIRFIYKYDFNLRENY